MSQGVDTRLCLPKTAWPPTLKIKGKPELQKNEKSKDLKKHVIKRGITRVAHCLRIIATQLMTLKQSALANNDQFRILLDFDVSVSRI